MPPWSAVPRDMRSKYTNRLRNTSFVVGQYLRIRSKYDSIEMVGTFRAWKRAVARLCALGERWLALKVLLSLPPPEACEGDVGEVGDWG